jgi:hypothetical protein
MRRSPRTSYKLFLCFRMSPKTMFLRIDSSLLAPALRQAFTVIFYGLPSGASEEPGAIASFRKLRASFGLTDRLHSQSRPFLMPEVFWERDNCTEFRKTLCLLPTS